MPRLAGVPDDIALLTGPMLLGNLFGYGLFGILIVQVFTYHYRFPRDPIELKVLVWSIFAIDILITVLATITAWNGLAVGWGDLATLAPLDWPFGGLPLLSGLVSSAVHLFFCWRIWKLRKSVLLPAIIALTSFLQWGMASYCGIRGRSLGIVRINELKPYVIAWLGGSTICDVLITSALVYILFKAGTKTSFQETSSVVGKLITLTVETGMVTAAGALSELILFLVFPSNNMHFLPFLMLAKLYSNTLLATLNARAILAHYRDAPRPALWNEDTTFGQASSSRGQTRASAYVGSYGAGIGVGSVHISTTVERRGDVEMVVLPGDRHASIDLDGKRKATPC